MDDSEVIEAFLEGASAAFGPNLAVERGTLKLEGWWSVAYRVSDRTVILRDEQEPTDSTAVADVSAALSAKGLSAVGCDLPAIGALTYTNIDLGYAPWVLWSTDLAAGEEDLNARVSEESFLEGGSTTGGGVVMDNLAANARGARRLAGDETRVVLLVGASDETAARLRDGVGDCRFERREFGEIAPEACGSLLPTLVLVDATTPAGRAFIGGLQAGESVGAPVVAITPGGQMQAGADATVAATDPPEAWLSVIGGLLQ